MIVKEYYQNIDCYHPKNYFEKWYADVWRRRINKRLAAPGVLDPILKEEIASCGAVLTEKDNGYRFVVTFENDIDYTAFVLKWS